MALKEESQELDEMEEKNQDEKYHDLMAEEKYFHNSLAYKTESTNLKVQMSSHWREPFHLPTLWKEFQSKIKP